GDQHPVGVAEHPVLGDGPGDLLADVVEEAVAAEGGVVAPHLHDRGATAALAAHRHDHAPPEMAKRTSTLSPSRSSSWLVSRAPSRITRTAPGSTSRRASRSATRRASGPPPTRPRAPRRGPPQQEEPEPALGRPGGGLRPQGAPGPAKDQDGGQGAPEQ